MNLKLDVVRLTNEDVIATSGIVLCSYLDVDNPSNDNDHIYVTALGLNNTVTYFAHGNPLTYKGNNGKIGVLWFAESPEINTWYHYSSSNGGEFVKCTEQSNDAHPENPR